VSCEIQEYTLEPVISLIQASPHDCAHLGDDIVHTTHLGTHMMAVNDHGNPSRAHDSLKHICDVTRHSFLLGESLRGKPHDARELRNADDHIILNIPNRGMAVKRQDVMLAEREKRNVRFDDLVMLACFTAFFGKDHVNPGISVIAGG
jgi:hypothetical protein